MEDLLALRHAHAEVRPSSSRPACAASSTSSSRAAPAPARRRRSTCSPRRSRTTSASSPSRTRPSSSSARSTSSRSRRARPTSRARARSSIRDLVRNCLRMRPDRIIVGECRGAETVDMLQAMNTGHDGSLTTIHANSPARRPVARRDAGADRAASSCRCSAIREQIASAPSTWSCRSTAWSTARAASRTSPRCCAWSRTSSRCRTSSSPSPSRTTRRPRSRQPPARPAALHRHQAAVPRQDGRERRATCRRSFFQLEADRRRWRPPRYSAFGARSRGRSDCRPALAASRRWSRSSPCSRWSPAALAADGITLALAGHHRLPEVRAVVALDEVDPDQPPVFRVLENGAPVGSRRAVGSAGHRHVLRPGRRHEPVDEGARRCAPPWRARRRSSAKRQGRRPRRALSASARRCSSASRSPTTRPRSTTPSTAARHRRRPGHRAGRRRHHRRAASPGQRGPDAPARDDRADRRRQRRADVGRHGGAGARRDQEGAGHGRTRSARVRRLRAGGPAAARAPRRAARTARARPRSSARSTRRSREDLAQHLRAARSTRRTPAASPLQVDAGGSYIARTNYAGGAPVRVKTGEGVVPPRRSRTRNWSVSALAGVTLLLFVLGGFAVLRPRPRKTLTAAPRALHGLAHARPQGRRRRRTVQRSATCSRASPW